MATPKNLTLGDDHQTKPGSPPRNASPRSGKLMRGPSPTPPSEQPASNPNPPRFPPEKPSTLPGPGHYYPGSSPGLAPTGPLNEHKRDPHTRHFVMREPAKDGAAVPKSEGSQLDPTQHSSFQPAEYWEESAAGPSFFPPPPHQPAPLKPMAADTGFLDLSQKPSVAPRSASVPAKGAAASHGATGGLGHSASEPGQKKKKKEPRWLTQGSDNSGLKAKAYRLCEASRELREYAEACSHPSLFDTKFQFELAQAKDRKKGVKKAMKQGLLTRWPSELELYGDTATGTFRTTASGRPLSAPRSPSPLQPPPPLGTSGWWAPPLLHPLPPPRPATPPGEPSRMSRVDQKAVRPSQFGGPRPQPTGGGGSRRSSQVVERSRGSLTSTLPKEAEPAPPTPNLVTPGPPRPEPEPESSEQTAAKAREYSAELLEQVAAVHDGSSSTKAPF